MHLAHQPRDADKPEFHLLSRSGGWINDPNGPLYYDGRYHLFWQHVPDSVEWSFGIVWGHAVSTDLVHWTTLPHALTPTPDSGDADGCFSGCAVLDACGRPTILYTGVRLRDKSSTLALPEPHHDIGLHFIESQCVAVPVEGDKLLRIWVKADAPMLPHPPANVPLAGWRDPFIFETGGNGKEWGMLIGSGIKGRNGNVMIYRSADLTSGWRFDGLLCEGFPDDNCGEMWECPLLLPLNAAATPVHPKHHCLHAHWSGSVDDDALADLPLPGGPASAPGCVSTAFADAAPSLCAYDSMSLDQVAGGSAAGADGLAAAAGPTHLFCVSPDAPTNPTLYWLGSYDAEASRFDVASAAGPFLLDLGDTLYAPNVLPKDGKGRALLWGWLQERPEQRPPPAVGGTSGCLSLPRVVALRDGRLVQEPAPELAALRIGDSWHASHLMVYPEAASPLEVVGGPRLEVEVTLTRGESRAAGLHLRSWRRRHHEAAVLVDWQRNTLQVVFTDGARIDLCTLADWGPETAGLRRVGGPIAHRPGEPLTLRCFIDHSCIEVYASSGEVLSTRFYRGAASADAEAGVSLVSYGGAARVEHVAAWEVGSIWHEEAAGAAALAVAADLEAAVGDKVAAAAAATDLLGDTAGTSALPLQAEVLPVAPLPLVVATPCS